MLLLVSRGTKEHRDVLVDSTASIPTEALLEDYDPKPQDSALQGVSAKM